MRNLIGALAVLFLMAALTVPTVAAEGESTASVTQTDTQAQSDGECGCPWGTSWWGSCGENCSDEFHAPRYTVITWFICGTTQVCAIDAYTDCVPVSWCGGIGTTAEEECEPPEEEEVQHH